MGLPIAATVPSDTFGLVMRLYVVVLEPQYHADRLMLVTLSSSKVPAARLTFFAYVILLHAWARTGLVEALAPWTNSY